MTASIHNVEQREDYTANRTPAATQHDQHPQGPAAQVEHYTEQAAGYEHPELGHVQPIPVQLVEAAPVPRQAAPKLITGQQTAPATGTSSRVVASDYTRRRLIVSNHGAVAVCLSGDPAMAAAGVGLVLAAGQLVTMEHADALHVAATAGVAGVVSWAAEVAPW